jgi:sec-independent protein translocase protein TatA
MFGIGPPELLVIFLIILILFGAKRLPELARSLGKSINEFKNATNNIKQELDFTEERDTKHQNPQSNAPEAEEKD